MTNAPLVMPGYVADMVILPLRKLGLDPLHGEDLITCPLRYEDGTELSIAIWCVAQRGWFRQKPMVAVTLMELAGDMRVVRVYLRDVLPCPTRLNDMSFFIRVSALVRAMAWAHATTGNMGECTDLPRQSM